MTKKSIEKDDAVIYINDHYNPYFLDQIRSCYPNTLMLQSFFCVYPPEIVPVTWVPCFLYENNYSTQQLSTSVDTVDCFNFMIYKLRELRLLALKFIEQRNYKTHHYTLNTTIKNFSDIKTQPRIFGDSMVEFYNSENWNLFLSKQVFEPTAVSLITETIEPQWGPCMTFTEKTIYSVIGLTFPIWLGGYLQAKTWAKFGFDTFDDVINHDYQFQTDSTLSMQQALDDNHKILTDLEYARYTRNSLLPRLIENRQRFLNYDFLEEILKILHHSFPDQAKLIENFFTTSPHGKTTKD